ncbi:67 kDa myosin-cross-reactive antigen family protein [Cadophora sp. MPI-SDFR-AT-0126]|nr:67 kDa myosin-cross-reactive antigen family protein [Leotiomycetes sp. MPI-SDFR-AT-0126]
MANSHTAQGCHLRKPEVTNAYLIGDGIASLASAVYLIHDARVPPSQIHVLESGPRGPLCSTGTADSGYFISFEQLLNFSCVCLYDLLSIVPSLNDAAKTVKQDIDEFNAIPGNRTYSNARLIATDQDGPQIVVAKELGLRKKDTRDLLSIYRTSEKKLSNLKVTDCFEEEFFKTNFWCMWATMFSFQPCHSAAEFRRYLHRFVLGLPTVDTLGRLDLTPYNQYESIILPIETYLKAQGVNFKYDTGAVRLAFAQSSDIKVEGIYFGKDGGQELIQVECSDIVFLTLGSTTACASIGSNDSPTGPVLSPLDTLRASDTGWRNWSSLFFSSLLNSPHITQLGNPMTFYSRITESCLLCFTVTLQSPEFFKLFEELTSNAPGRGGLTTLKDSSWLLTIVVPPQPYFLNQPDGVQVFWGYALFPAKIGDRVRKPMFDCTGQEIFIEVLGHLNFPDDSSWTNSITIPCLMPYATSPLLARASYEDRPPVIPKGSSNLALVGQFVEIPEDGVFPLEYSVRAAQTAVFKMMGMQKQPNGICKGGQRLKTLIMALKALLS